MLIEQLAVSLTMNPKFGPVQLAVTGPLPGVTVTVVPLVKILPLGLTFANSDNPSLAKLVKR
jgi:hypothetical protein